MDFFLFKSDFFIFIFPYESLCLYHVCTVSLETRQGHQISRVINDYATQCSCWGKKNPDSLQDDPVLLTTGDPSIPGSGFFLTLLYMSVIIHCSC